MTKNNWVFSDDPNVMVVTTEHIVKGKKNILIVYHDADDGIWQFLDDSEINDNDAMIISLEEMINIDDSIEEISNLPLGYVAWRKQKGTNWIVQKESI